MKDRSWGWFGHLIDIIAVLATIFGLATSLGFGAQQAASGLKFLFGIDNGMGTQVAIIIGVTAVALFSVVRGLEGGVKLLSNINMCLAAILLLFVVILGPTLAILIAMWTTASSYIENIIPLSNWIGREDEKFFHGWTVFYWAWWISWSPFVGMFIARISKGRTVREFIVAVLLVPTLVTLVWMSAFGGTALEQAQNEIGALAKGIGEVPLAMFQMLENLPIASITSFVAIVLVLVFFVTSSDSGSLVIDSITSGGKLDAPVPQRIFWATMEGVIAGALLFGGGGDALGALQAAAIAVGLPFTLVLLVMCIGVYMGLAHEWRFVQGSKAPKKSCPRDPGRHCVHPRIGLMAPACHDRPDTARNASGLMSGMGNPTMMGASGRGPVHPAANLFRGPCVRREIQSISSLNSTGVMTCRKAKATKRAPPPAAT